MPIRAVTDDWGARLAARVVDEVGVLAGGRLRPESAALLTDVTVRGYDLFVASLHGDAAGPMQMAGLVGDLFADVDISLEDAMALHRHLEQVLLKEVLDGAPRDLAGADRAQLEGAAHRFFNDLSAALADGYLAARRGRDGAAEAGGDDVLGCVLASPPRLGEARRVARAADVELDTAWQVTIVAAPPGRQLPRGLAARVRQSLFGTLVLSTSSAAGMVFAVQQAPAVADWPDLGSGTVCGVGGVHSDVRGLRDSHEEALEALDLARRKGVALLRFDDAWFDRFLLGAVTAEELAERVLEPVADLTPNRRSAILETLEAYLDSGSSVGAVAEALHLHRQSVNYRMQNVRRLFGPRLMSANGRLALHIAVKAARLQRP
ncbi:MAG: hypothetical protein QOE05_1394 [Actinomycetota bacterium]|nr:hypothetical protein [Actinomycetota bacterium]